jgi:imidazolonepropionase-like amidohydrolase
LGEAVGKGGGASEADVGGGTTHELSKVMERGRLRNTYTRIHAHTYSRV